jgi:glycosyltransferase involved in cell wall biosynthesis
MANESARDKTVLILAYYFPPRNAAGAARPFRFYKYLPKFGYVPKVICDGSGMDAASAANVVAVSPGQPASPFLRITATGLRLFQRVFLSKGALEWLPYAVQAARRAMVTEKACAVLSTFPPLSTHLAALVLQRAYGIKWIADFRDPLAGDISRRRHGRLLRQLMEKAIFRRADLVVANTEAAAEMFRWRYPKHAKKVHVIWNGFDPEDRLECLPLPNGDRRVMIQAGDIYSFRHPGRLLLALERLKSQDAPPVKDLVVQLFGDVDRPWDGIGDGAVERLLNHGWVQCHSQRIPQEDARRRTAEAHYLLLCDWAGPDAGVHVPVKLFDYIRIGRPILAMTKRGSSVHWILGRSGIPCMYLFDDDSDAEIDKKLATFFQWSSDPASPSPWFLRTFDGAEQVRELAGLLEGRT